VIDDGPGFDAGAVSPKGHGLANTRERVHALYGQGGSLTVSRAPAGGTVATLRIPFHPLTPEPDRASR
jgi:two-component system LytT family sensor kinase